MSASVSFFIGCVIACVFFQLGLRISKTNKRYKDYTKLKNIDRKTILTNYNDDISRILEDRTKKNVYNIEDYRERKEAAASWDHSLVRSKNTGEFFRVPKEFGDVLKAVEEKYQNTTESEDD